MKKSNCFKIAIIAFSVMSNSYGNITLSTSFMPIEHTLAEHVIELIDLDIQESAIKTVFEKHNCNPYVLDSMKEHFKPLMKSLTNEYDRNLYKNWSFVTSTDSIKLPKKDYHNFYTIKKSLHYTDSVTLAPTNIIQGKATLNEKKSCTELTALYKSINKGSYTVDIFKKHIKKANFIQNDPYKSSPTLILKTAIKSYRFIKTVVTAYIVEKGVDKIFDDKEKDKKDSIELSQLKKELKVETEKTKKAIKAKEKEILITQRLKKESELKEKEIKKKDAIINTKEKKNKTLVSKLTAAEKEKKKLTSENTKLKEKVEELEKKSKKSKTKGYFEDSYYQELFSKFKKELKNKMENDCMGDTRERVLGINQAPSLMICNSQTLMKDLNRMSPIYGAKDQQLAKQEYKKNIQQRVDDLQQDMSYVSNTNENLSINYFNKEDKNFNELLRKYELTKAQFERYKTKYSNFEINNDEILPERLDSLGRLGL